MLVPFVTKKSCPKPVAPYAAPVPGNVTAAQVTPPLVERAPWPALPVATPICVPLNAMPAVNAVKGSVDEAHVAPAFVER